MSARSVLEEVPVAVHTLKGHHRLDWTSVEHGTCDILCPLRLGATWCFGVYVEPCFVAFIESVNKR